MEFTLKSLTLGSKVLGPTGSHAACVKVKNKCVGGDGGWGNGLSLFL